MRADEISVKGVHNLLRGFWKQVREDLDDPDWRDDAESFLSDPARLAGWCHLTGIQDRDAWAAMLRGGVLPPDAVKRIF